MECPGRAAPKPRSDATGPCRDRGGGDDDPPGDAREATKRGWIRRRPDRFCVCDVSLRGPSRPGSAHGATPVVPEYGTTVLLSDTNLNGAWRFCQPSRGTLRRPEAAGGGRRKGGTDGGPAARRGRAAAAPALPPGVSAASSRRVSPPVRTIGASRWTVRPWRSGPTPLSSCVFLPSGSAIGG